MEEGYTGSAGADYCKHLVGELAVVERGCGWMGGFVRRVLGIVMNGRVSLLLLS